jgi:hypothetical protein
LGYCGGVKVTLADPVVTPSATLVAITETVCVEVMLAGAVYRPVLPTVPTPFGLVDQATAIFPLDTLATVAVNCCVWDCPRVAVAGATLTVRGGYSRRLAEALCGPFAEIAAVIVTTCCAEIWDGAV